MAGRLLFIVGPPAVGKMTVGEQIAARTGLRCFTAIDLPGLIDRVSSAAAHRIGRLSRSGSTRSAPPKHNPGTPLSR